MMFNASNDLCLAKGLSELASAPLNSPTKLSLIHKYILRVGADYLPVHRLAYSE